ncbi:uncharacterized protein LOC110098680 [Dendrobium catenatum]|uniref:uncharacterized protein LOC110098680 n=1 Tax=Dendrobium catenatum TaxID=906689 RepID=UPI0009F718C3|nr:uncharacterized protein LOC110098680 [Dendrobium catenatum]
MKSFITYNDLHEVGCIGSKFTWCDNKKGDERILEKLDRCLLNSASLNSSHSLVVRHLARVATGHCPILLTLLEFNVSCKRNIKFEDIWASIPASMEVVRDAWRRKSIGELSQILIQKMNVSLKALYYWSKAKHKDLNQSKDELKKEILNLQLKEAEFDLFSDEDMWLLKTKIDALNSTLARLCTWWRQGAKVKWLMKGDSNSRFFHAYASARRNSNFIHKIKDENGLIVEDQHQIEDVLFSYFKDKWKERNCSMVGWAKPWKSLNEEDLLVVDRNFFMGEMEKVIKDLDGNIAPGHDGTSGFFERRSLSDHVSVAHEVFHKFRYSKSSKGLVSFKIDMEHACNSMGWPTLFKALEYCGFPTKFANLILDCVYSPCFSLSINENFSNWIEARSSFRQGCPLSPFLFIICAQLLLNAFSQKKDSDGIRISPNGPKITRLLYADDIIIFSEASMKMIMEIKSIISDFCGWTGQRVNSNKYGILFGKTIKRKKRKAIARLMNFKKIKEFSYLGIKVALRRLVMADFQFLLDKALNMLSVWGEKFISLAERITLVKSVLLSFPTFHSTLSFVLKSVLNEVDKLCRSFIWSKKAGGAGLHYVSWESICRLNNLGGRGIVSCSKKAGPLRTKLAWRAGSSAWKLLCNGGEFLKPIVKWRIANERSVNVIKDTWLLDRSIDKWPTFVQLRECNDLTVDKFICNGCLDVGKLGDFFGPDLVNLISGIQIYSECSNDQLELIHRLSGGSISALATETMDKCNTVFVGCNWLKNAKRSSRVETFWWRVLNNAIPTNQFLSYKSLQGILDVNQPTRLLNNYWYPPPPDWIKVNIDTSLCPSYKAGIGDVFHDHKGRFLMAFGQKWIHWDIASLELQAILSIKDVVKYWMFAYKGLIIEGDNKIVINFIQDIVRNL